MKLKNLNKFFIIISLILSILILNKFISNKSIKNDILSVHFIDVGQGDASLITFNNKNILIDSGPAESRNNLFNYLENLNIEKLHYVIATHPHDDHIGNMSSIIKNYKIDNFLSPKISTNSNHFENMIYSLKDSDLKITPITSNTSINIENKLKLSFFTLPKEYESDNLNLYSPFIKLSFGNISFLFTGDAEDENEKNSISKNHNLKSQILKVAHHGSKTSSSKDFLNYVSPVISVISVGNNNKFKHPSKDTLDNLKSINSKILRTDTLGSIVLSTDGYKIFKYFPDK